MDCDAKLARPAGLGLLKMGTPAIAVLLFAVTFCPAAAANTSIFNHAGTACTATSQCTQLATFGILTGINDSVTVNGNWDFGSEAGIGLQTGSTLKVAGTGTSANTFGSIIDFADAIHSTTGNCGAPGSGVNPNLCGSGAINGATTTASTLPVRNNTLVTAAGTQLTNIETYLAGVTGPVTKVPFATTGAVHISESGSNYNASTHVTFFDNGTTAYSQTGAITIGCTAAGGCANDIVIIKLASTTSSTFNANINLSGGLTSDQVIFYLSAAGMTVSSTSAAFTVNGDFFLTSSKTATLSQTTNTPQSIDFEGRIYGSSILFNTKSGVGGYENPGTPEPATWVLMAGGLAAGLWLHRRRKHATRSDA